MCVFESLYPTGTGCSYLPRGPILWWMLPKAGRPARRYQEQHSFPFREALKDKVYNGHICRYAEGDYACFFGWPNLTHTPTGGFLGLPGNECRVDMRVVDVYRREGDKLAENWVIIDLPWWLKQQGLDILERCKNITAGT